MGLGAAILVDGEPDAELGAAASVEVYECMGEATTYRIHYAVKLGEANLLPLLGNERLSAGSELAIVVEVGGQLACLVKGPVCGQQIRLTPGGGGELDVLGADRSIALDRENKAKVWSDATDADIVGAILHDHFDGRDVASTAATYSEAKHLLVQRESDLALIRRLARRNGFLFWVTCDGKGKETAHFKRPPTGDGAVAELLINIDPPKIASLEITWDAERPVSATAGQLDLNTKADIDGAVARSPLPALGKKELASIAPGVQSLHLAAPADTAGDLAARAEAALIDASFFVRASCSTTTKSLGTLLRAHTVVKLSGVGARHSGTYFCAGVRHTIDHAAHHMDVELLRNAWGA